jgi:hypothetical protein
MRQPWSDEDGCEGICWDGAGVCEAAGLSVKALKPKASAPASATPATKLTID